MMGRAKSMNNSVLINTDCIHASIAANTTVKFKYFHYDLKLNRNYSRKGETFEVSPWALLYDNDNYYLYARRGDTFRSIGQEIGISYKKIARYNERDRDDRLQEGEVIWLKKKQKRAPKEYKDRLHYIREGESMYTIAQKYGIRLESLYKMNHLSPDYQIRVGDALKLR